MLFIRKNAFPLFAIALSLSMGQAVLAQNYTVTNLVSSDPSVPALLNDPNLVNGWGLSRSSTSPWWISDNGTGKSTLYDGAGTPQALVVTIPPAQAGNTGVPTGTIFNQTPNFLLAPNTPALFLFATEDGTVSGWNPAVSPTSAVVKITVPHAVFKGMAAANVNGTEYLYVTNFTTGKIDVCDGAFQRVRLDRHAFELREEWSDNDHDRDRDELCPGLVPYNIQNIGGTLFVSFALPDGAHHDSVSGNGLGAVASFAPTGRLIKVFQHGSFFNAPWGIALAPSDFGGFSHSLLVGQFGSGQILAFNISTGRFIGKLADPNGQPIAIDGLWDISFGNGAKAGPLNTLYFAAGPADESKGLFGSITPLANTQVMGNGL